MPGLPSTARRRLALLGAVVAALVAVELLLPGLRESLLWWSPLVVLVGLMLAGVRPDELVERFAGRRAAGARAARPARRLGAARASSAHVVRSGLLIALSLATRPPPALRAAAR